jgi:glycerol dehydrogenase
MTAAIKACDPKDSLHHEAGIITPDKVYNAMILANEYGKRLKVKSLLNDANLMI